MSGAELQAGRICRIRREREPRKVFPVPVRRLRLHVSRHFNHVAFSSTAWGGSRTFASSPPRSRVGCAADRPFVLITHPNLLKRTSAISENHNSANWFSEFFGRLSSRRIGGTQGRACDLQIQVCCQSVDDGCVHDGTVGAVGVGADRIIPFRFQDRFCSRLAERQG